VLDSPSSRGKRHARPRARSCLADLVCLLVRQSVTVDNFLELLRDNNSVQGGW
jgi:hypothetical protein